MAKANALNLDLSNCTGISLAGAQVTGNLDKSHFGGGVGANSGTYFRGDGTWQSMSVTGTVNTSSATNRLAYYSGAGTNTVISEFASTNYSILTTNASAVPTWVSLNGDGLTLIGSSSGPPLAAEISSGSLVNVSYGGAFNLRPIAPALSSVTATSASMIFSRTYVSNNAALVTLTLPATAPAGSVIRILGLGAGGWTIAQNAGQSITVGGSTSTIGVTGSVASSNQYDTVKLICIVADTEWSVLGKPLSSGLIVT